MGLWSYGAIGNSQTGQGDSSFSFLNVEPDVKLVPSLKHSPMI